MNNSKQCWNLALHLDPLCVVASVIAPPKPFTCRESSVQHWWHRLVEMLTRAHELRVWQGRDRVGNDYWQAYDPATGQSITAGSETEIRAWIEEGRYQ